MTTQLERIEFGLGMSPSHRAYLTALTSGPADQVRAEPGRLASLAVRLQQDIEDVAVHNYRIFLESARCFEHGAKIVLGIDKKLVELHDAVRQLHETTNGFMDRADELVAARNLQSCVFDNHAQILELLEIPAVITRCIRTEQVDESLDLVACAQSLCTRYAQIPLLGILTKQVDEACDLMKETLLSMLESNTKLARSLEIVGFLRRLRAFDLVELRRQFLYRRSVWLDSQLRDLERRTTYSYVSKYLDVFRIELLEVVTQYIAIFNVEDYNATLDEGARPLLPLWVAHRIQDIRCILGQNLEDIAGGASLFNLLEQAMHCAASLGRVGFDFRALLVPLFDRRIISIIGTLFDQASADFADSLDQNGWHYDEVALQRLGITGTDDSDPSEDGVSVRLPTILLSFAPLAAFVSGVNLAFNELRHCASVSLAAEVAELLTKVLTKVSNLLFSAYNAIGGNDEAEKIQAKATELNRMINVYVDTCVPFIFECMAAVYGCEGLLDRAMILGPVEALVVKQRPLKSLFDVNDFLVESRQIP